MNDWDGKLPLALRPAGGPTENPRDFISGRVETGIPEK